jgi:hypothetical protein
MSNDTVQEIERNIKQAKSLVEYGDALERLKSNKDFKKIILEGFFEKEAIRLVHLKADRNMQNVDVQKSIITQMDAVGTLHQYFNTILVQANQASKSIAADEEARDELLAEELE